MRRYERSLQPITHTHFLIANVTFKYNFNASSLLRVYNYVSVLNQSFFSTWRLLLIWIQPGCTASAFSMTEHKGVWDGIKLVIKGPNIILKLKTVTGEKITLWELATVHLQNILQAEYPITFIHNENIKTAYWLYNVNLAIKVEPYSKLVCFV